jgi:hypothetical protein
MSLKVRRVKCIHCKEIVKDCNSESKPLEVDMEAESNFVAWQRSKLLIINVL